MISTQLRIFLMIVILLFFGIVLYFLKQKKLNLKYTLIWLFASVVLIIISIFPELVYIPSEKIGIVAPSNLIFVIEAIFVVLILLSLTVIVSHITEQIFRLTQTIAMLEKRVRELEDDRNVVESER